MVPSMRRLLVLVTLVPAALAALSAPAHAHGDDGVITITDASATGTRVHVAIGLTYANDDDLATEATVSAVLTGPAGEKVGPVSLPRTGDGAVYQADIDVPSSGSWSVEVDSTGPTAKATATVDVTAPTSTTEPVPTTAQLAPSTTLGTTTTTPASDGTTAADEDDDGNGVLIGVLVGAGVLLLGGAGYAVARSRRG